MNKTEKARILTLHGLAVALDCDLRDLYVPDSAAAMFRGNEEEDPGA